MASDDLHISTVDCVYIKIDAEQGILYELMDYFTFDVLNAQFMPLVRQKMWDGKIRLFNAQKKTLYAGLLSRVEQFAQSRNYTICYEKNLGTTDEFSLQEAKDFIDKLNLPFDIRDYQLQAFTHAVRKRRCVLECPTASGKSLIIYALCRAYATHKKVLIVVPTVSLVAQMYSDFEEYSQKNGWDVDRNVHQIMQGRDKNSEKPIVISTWQSVFKMPKEYFEQYDFVIGDECHQFKAKSLTSIMTKLTNARHRIGTTGTLDDSETHQLVLEGLFGRSKKIVSTKELIDKKVLANFNIKAIILKYPDDVCKAIARKKYHEEIDLLVGSEKRNNFIRNLAVSLEGNTLVLFQYVEKHGNHLYESIKKLAGKNRKVFYVYGGTAVELREQVRSIVEQEKDAIIVASYGVFSTGVNIKNLHNIIFAHPGKSKIRVLQSIGRVLRTLKGKTSATLYDIVDDLSHGNHKNFAIKHFLERHKFYTTEKFPINIYKVNLKS